MSIFVVICATSPADFLSYTTSEEIDVIDSSRLLTGKSEDTEEELQVRNTPATSLLREEVRLEFLMTKLRVAVIHNE